MTKQIIYVIVASLIVVLLGVYISQVLQYFLQAHALVLQWFANLFASNRIGMILMRLLSLFLVPLIVTGVISGIYWIFKRRAFPWFEQLLWVLWIILSTAIVLQHG